MCSKPSGDLAGARNFVNFLTLFAVRTWKYISLASLGNQIKPINNLCNQEKSGCWILNDKRVMLKGRD